VTHYTSTYGGRDGIGSVFETAKLGDRVSVIYDPTNPTMSALGKTEEKLWQLSAMSIVLALISGILGTVVLNVIWDQWRKTRI
jgi:hypothetical protein